MRLIGVAMVRNEADIVEAFVRHNLTVLDAMVVVDHGSLDGTEEILALLQREGLPLRVIRDASPGFFQAERMTAVAREAFARERADFVFVVDADEFIKTPSRVEVERELAALPVGVHASISWLTYVPKSFGGGTRAPEIRWRLRTERHGSRKCVVSRSFAERTKQYLVSGNHLVDDLATPKPPPHARLPASVAALAHYPVRSPDQLMRKVVLGYLAHLATRPDNDRQAAHWRDLFVELRDGATFDDERVRLIAFNYGLARDAWRPFDGADLVEDPVAIAFDLRYPRAAPVDTLRLLMRFTERLLRH